MKAFVLAIVLCVAATAAFAQQSDPNAPASKEDVQRYLDAMHSHDMMKKTMEAMEKPMHQMVHDQFLKHKDKLPADFEQKQIAMLDNMYENMPLDQIMEAMVPVYQRHFTKGDIDSLIAFYSSPTGQKMIREMPAITAETMQQAMPLIEKSVESVQEQFQQQLAQALKNSEKKAD